MRRLTYRNARGEEIEFYLSPLVIESLTGIGEVDADIQSQTAPYQDGDQYIDTRLQPRFIALEGTISKSKLTEIKDYRQLILRTCNPKFGMGKITLELDGDIKEIDAVLDGGPVFPERGQNVFQKFSITWKCPNPYWKNLKQVSQPLKAYIGTFTLPFTLPFELGISESRTVLYNEGNVSTPIRIDIQGPVTNPQIINRTTGEWLRINRSIAADELLHIDTTPGQKKVEIHRNDQVYSAFGYLDHDSEWITLDLGYNEIEHIADAGDNTSLVSITWNSYFIGM